MQSSCRGVPGGANSAAACITLQAKIILADFNLVVSTPTAKFKFPSNRQLYYKQKNVDEV